MKTAKTITASEAIRRDLRAVLSESPAITSPECLKNSIMKARFVEHFTDAILASNPTWARTDAVAYVRRQFDAAVDEIYAQPS